MHTMLFLTVQLFVACQSDNKLQRHADDPNSAYHFPTIIVEPTTLDFGALSGGDVAEEVFTITNQGTEMSELTVDAIALTLGNDAGFSITTMPELPLVLGWEQTTEVVVTFSPGLPGETTGQVVVESDDELHPEVPVGLRGEGLVPYLVVDPPTYDFGGLTAGCEATTTFSVRNDGNDALTLEDVVSEGAGYAVTARPVLPAVLAPGEAVPVTVAFAPGTEATFGGGIVAVSDDPRGDQRAAITGNGVLPGTYHDAYAVPTGGRVDLLVFVDQSVSMNDDQVTLATNAQAFGEGLSTLTDDWHLMVVTADDGCSVSGIITPATPNCAAVIADTVLAGEEGSHSERGLYVSYLAVQAADAFECNEGFLREDALLHVIYISDESDQSPEPWTYYVDALRAMKGAEHLVKMSAVAGDVPSGCSTDENSASSGRGYYEAVEATHGGFVSLCSDWSTQIATMAGYGVTRDTFALSARPDPNTITVLVNGTRRGTGWHYMSDSNSVVFSAGVPVSGDSVDITYVVPVTCTP